MTASASLHHATSADDLMLRHTHNMQDGDCIDVYEAIEDQCPHSDNEADVDVSSVSMSSTTTQEPVEIAFSASGGAFVYQMGIAAYMQEHFDLSECHFSGCSGGSWAATLLASDTDVNKAWSTIKNTRMRVVPGEASWYTGYGGRYSTIIADTIKDLWKNDPDVHLRVQKKKLAIAVTKFPSLKPERHTSWTDLEDLMKSILASALIPFALSGKPCIEHRGQWYVDGGITNFKGVNCEDYSTWGDIYYHGMNMAVDAVRSTTSAVAERFFPSLTKPVAKLINGLLPQVQSPHDAVAPRITNGAANPQCSSADTSDKSRPRILIMPWTWRSHHLTAFHLTLDMDTHQQRFDMGYEDARAHHEELATLLPPKSSIVAEV